MHRFSSGEEKRTAAAALENPQNKPAANVSTATIGASTFITRQSRTHGTVRRTGPDSTAGASAGPTPRQSALWSAHVRYRSPPHRPPAASAHHAASAGISTVLGPAVSQLCQVLQVQQGLRLPRRLRYPQQLLQHRGLPLALQEQVLPAVADAMRGAALP